MRRVLQAVVGVTSAVAVFAMFYLAIFWFGGADCYSGDCNWVGDTASDHPWGAAVIGGLVSICLGFLAARVVAKRQSLPR